jgi:asparagine N-glycosylation enzyme membrane subunit Stt3
VTIDKTLNGLSQTPTELATDSGFDITDPDAAFTKIFDYQLFANSDTYRKKYMAGNPFPYAFDVTRIFMKNTANSAYYPLADGNNSDYISPLIYTHDSPDITGGNIEDGGGYRVLDANTPGFVDKVRAMEGFFLIFPVNDSGTQNNFAFPLMTQYGN